VSTTVKLAHDVTLTLTSIAGFVLTMGITVDANVIIFERIKEEYWSGKSPATAIDIGFKRAFWTIMDSHVTSLIAVVASQTAIGILAADAYDPLRAKLNAVAFQGKGQNKAYYADSDANSVDKKNVRDGHYVIQGPLHFFSALTNGAPSTTAKQVLDWLTGAKPIDPTDTSNTGYTTTVAVAGDVPQCAMKVQISTDGGLFSPFTPPVSCGCFFTKVVNKLSTAPAGCVACTSDSGCTGGKRCQTGFCE